MFSINSNVIKYLNCNLCGHLQRCQMPDIENSRKNSRKKCRVGPGQTAEKQPEKQPKRPKNSCFDCFSQVFRLFFRLFFGCLTGTHSALFSAVFPAVFNVGQFGTSVGGRRDCNTLRANLRMWLPSQTPQIPQKIKTARKNRSTTGSGHLPKAVENRSEIQQIM